MSEAVPVVTKQRNLGLIFTALMMTMLLAALDQTIVSTALPTITSDLGGLNELSWVVTAYLLAATASTPIWGKLSDLYGRKLMLQSAVAIFVAASALAGLSQSMAQLIGTRALQGIGGGGLMVLVMAVIADIVSPRERGKYMGLFGAVFGVASVIGPLLGACSQSTSAGAGSSTSTSRWGWRRSLCSARSCTCPFTSRSTHRLAGRGLHGHRDGDAAARGRVGRPEVPLGIGTDRRSGCRWASWRWRHSSGRSCGTLSRWFRCRCSDCRCCGWPQRWASSSVSRCSGRSSSVDLHAGRARCLTDQRGAAVVATDAWSADHVGRQRSVDHRTGRYKIFPILGSGTATVGLFMLSRCGSTPTFGSYGFPPSSSAPDSAVSCRFW